MASTEIGRPVESDPIVNPLANLCLGISFCIPPLLLLLALGMFGQPAFSGLPGMSALLYVSYAPIGGVVLLALLVIALCLMLRLKGLIIPKTPLFKASVALLIGIAEFVLVLSLRDSVHRFHSALNLKVIGIASHAHHRDHEHFPGNILSADGKPLLSWRVALLPDLNEDSLYRRFKSAKEEAAKPDE